MYFPTVRKTLLLDTKKAEVVVRQVSRWVIESINVEGLPDFPPDREDSYDTSDEAIKACARQVESVTGETVRAILD